MATLTKAPAIGYLNRASGKTITVSSANASYPGSNLNNPLLSSVWRSVAGTLTSVTVDVDLASALDIDVIALLGANFQDAATVAPKTSEASNFSTTEYNPGTLNCFDVSYSPVVSDTPIVGRNVIILPGSTYNSRYVRLTLNDSGNPDNYLKSSVYWVGPLFQFPQGLDITSERAIEFVGNPGLERAITLWRVVVANLTEAQSRNVIALTRAYLRSHRYLFIPHPLDTKTFLHEVTYCTMVSPPRQVMLPSYDSTNHQLWQVEMEFREVED